MSSSGNMEVMIFCSGFVIYLHLFLHGIHLIELDASHARYYLHAAE